MPSPQAAAARAEMRREAAAIGLDEALISDVVERFYARIRSDALLGPIFAARISDWPPHLAQMKDFWSSVLLSTGRFIGSPMQKHIAIAELEPAHFAHWLGIFCETVRGIASPEAAEAFIARAERIAESLKLGLLHHRGADLTAHA